MNIYIYISGQPAEPNVRPAELSSTTVINELVSIQCNIENTYAHTHIYIYSLEHGVLMAVCFFDSWDVVDHV